MSEGRELWDAVIVGGGLAGLTAAVYLGRSVENYLGFPEGLSSSSLLDRGRAQVRQFGPNIAAGQGVTGGQAIAICSMNVCSATGFRGWGPPSGSWSVE